MRKVLKYAAWGLGAIVLALVAGSGVQVATAGTEAGRAQGGLRFRFR
jgi:hypothetical protein